MNCRDAERLLSADRDGALDRHQRASLEQHVAACSSCQRWRAQLAAAGAVWRKSAQAVTVPDSTLEWHAVRRRIRNGETIADGDSIFTRASRGGVWTACALAAALVLVAFLGPRWWNLRNAQDDFAETARAEFVEGPDGGSTPVVFVDNDSGWLVIWSVEGATEAGS